MSASEKLKALSEGHTMSGLKVIPIYRKTGPVGGGDASFTRARDVESIMDVLPQIVAVVEAAEEWDRIWSEEYGSNWQETRAALAALDEALA